MYMSFHSRGKTTRRPIYWKNVLLNFSNIRLLLEKKCVLDLNIDGVMLFVCLSTKKAA